MKEYAQNIIDLSESKGHPFKQEDYGINVFVSGVKIEWHWQNACIKLGYGNSKDDIVKIRRYVEDHIYKHSDSSKGGLILIYKNPSVDNFNSVLNQMEIFDKVLEKPLKLKRIGHIEPNYDNIFLKVAKLIKFAIDNKMPGILSSRGGGAFDNIDDIIVHGKSINYTENDKWREHVVPCNYMMRLGVEMFSSGKTENEVESMLERCCKIVLISNAERKIIDSKYKNGMPEEWNYETDDVFARLSICNIDWDPI
jgi:hypothetical protein